MHALVRIGVIGMAALLVCGGWLRAAEQPKAGSRPNVIFILTDDQG